MPRRVIAFLFRPDETQIALAKQWLELVTEETTIYTIPLHRPETSIKQGDIIVTFGTTTKLVVNSPANAIPDTDLICLPALNLLQNTPTCVGNRKEARDLLETIPSLKQKEIRESVNQLSTIDLPIEDNWEVSLTALLNTTATRFFTARSGKKIQVGGEQDPFSDIYLTVEELLMISKIMQTLGVKEVKFERPSKD